MQKPTNESFKRNKIKKKELLDDLTFSKGIQVLKTNILKTNKRMPDNREKSNDFQKSAWGISFQSAPLNRKNVVYEKHDGYHIYKDQLNVFKIKASDNGSIDFKLHSREGGTKTRNKSVLEYKSQIFVEQNLKKHQKLIDMNALNIRLDGMIDQCVDQNGDAYDPERHGAALSWFFILSSDTEENTNQSERRNEKEFFWFCVPVFDCRHDFIKSSAHIDSEFLRDSHELIYSMGSQMYLDEPIEYEKPYSIEIDIFPYLRDAFVYAVNNEFLINARFEDMTINAMHIGWMVNGVFDVVSSIQNISVTCHLK